jgi:hypothetical protein
MRTTVADLGLILLILLLVQRRDGSQSRADFSNGLGRALGRIAADIGQFAIAPQVEIDPEAAAARPNLVEPNRIGFHARLTGNFLTAGLDRRRTIGRDIGKSRRNHAQERYQGQAGHKQITHETLHSPQADMTIGLLSEYHWTDRHTRGIVTHGKNFIRS